MRHFLPRTSAASRVDARRNSERSCGASGEEWDHDHPSQIFWRVSCRGSDEGEPASRTINDSQWNLPASKHALRRSETESPSVLHPPTHVSDSRFAVRRSACVAVRAWYAIPCHPSAQNGRITVLRYKFCILRWCHMIDTPGTMVLCELEEGSQNQNLVQHLVQSVDFFEICCKVEESQ